MSRAPPHPVQLLSIKSPTLLHNVGLETYNVPKNRYANIHSSKYTQYSLHSNLYLYLVPMYVQYVIQLVCTVRTVCDPTGLYSTYSMCSNWFVQYIQYVFQLVCTVCTVCVQTGLYSMYSTYVFKLVCTVCTVRMCSNWFVQYVQYVCVQTGLYCLYSMWSNWFVQYVCTVSLPTDSYSTYSTSPIDACIG